MFKFSPLNWMSSLVLSKFLKVYLKHFDHSNLDVGFWDGRVSVKNVQLRNDLLVQQGLPFEIIDSYIEEVKVIIPWKNISKESIEVEISNVRITVSNKVRILRKTQEFQEELQRVKQDILAKFEELIQREDNFGEQGSSSFVFDFVSKILSKLKLVINNVDLFMIYEINNYEVVKFGVGFSKLNVKESSEAALKKSIQVVDAYLLFDFYDSILPQPLQQDNDSRIESQKKIHILKKLGLTLDISMNFQNQLEIDLKIQSTKILVYFKQRQIRLLLRAMQDILNHRTDRPIEPPKKGVNAKQWWLYARERIKEKEFIVIKVKKNDLSTYSQTKFYVENYTKKMLKQAKENDLKQLARFELKNTLTQILKLRSKAVQTIIINRNKLQITNPAEYAQKKEAQLFFQKYIENFNMEHASNLRFSQKVVNENLTFVKEKESTTRISLCLEIPQINVLIEENQILQQLKNLHEQVKVFKKELQNKKNLQTKVLDHIKNNFLARLSKVTVSANEQCDNEWTLEELLKHKLLVNLEVKDIKLEVIQSGEFKKLMKLKLSKLTLYDTNRLNSNYTKILDFQEGMKLLMSSEQLETQKKILDLDPLEKTIQVHLDVQIGAVNITLCKPLFERLVSLKSLVFFETKVEQPQSETAQKLFDSYLVTTKRIQSNTNLSFTISKVNLYLPIRYSLQADMLLIHLKQIKVFKREHYNGMVNIYQDPAAQADTKLNMQSNIKSKLPDRISRQNSLIDEQNLKPLFVSLDCLRVAFVESQDWEEKENMFQIQYRIILQRAEEESRDPGIETLFETLPIKIRMEQSQQCEEIGEQYEDKKLNFKRKIYPSRKTITVTMPFLDIKISVKHLYQLQQIGAIWSTSGYDFYDVIKTEPKKAREGSINIPPYLRNKLQNYFLSTFKLQMDGLQLSLIMNTTEFLKKQSGDSVLNQFHSNKLITLYFLDLNYCREIKFFESLQNLTINELILQNNNCHNYNLDKPLTKLSVQLLSQGEMEEQIVDNFGDELELAINDQSEIQHIREDVEAQNFNQKIPSIKQTLDGSEKFHYEPLIDDFHKPGQCKQCMNRLLINFQRVQNQPDINFIQVKEEQSDIKVELNQIFIIADPEIIKQIRYILDIGQTTADIKKKVFIQWMRSHGFWPDFTEVDTEKVEKTTQNFLSAEQTKITSVLQVSISQVCIMMNHKNQLVYVFNLNDLSTRISSCVLFTKIFIQMRQVRLFDTALITGKHTIILDDYKEENSIDVELNIYNNEDLIAAKRYTTYCGVRINQARIVFLKRITNEIQYYIRKVLLSSFSTSVSESDIQDIWRNINKIPDQSIHEDSNQVVSPYGFKFSLVCLDSQAIAYRNSLSDDAIYLRFAKIGFWFTGKWGQLYDNLIKLGKFDGELDDINEQFMDAQENFNSNDEFHTIREEDQEAIQIVNIWGLEVRSCDGEDEKDLFIKAHEDHQVQVKIIFDWEHLQEKDQPGVRPMYIHVNLPVVKICAYDLDYCTIVKFFMENLGEQPQTIVSPYNYDETNETFWMVLDIDIGSAIAKFFNGTRDDLTRHQFGRGEKDHLKKNAASVAFVKLKELNFKFMMRENGGKKMKLSIRGLDLFDFRESSLMMNSKEVLFGLLDKQFVNEEETVVDVKEDFDEHKEIEPVLISDSEEETQKDAPKVERSSKKENTQVTQQSNNSKGQKSCWERFTASLNRILCCRKAKKYKSKNRKSGAIKSEVVEEQIQLEIEDPVMHLIDYPREAMKGRRWINHRYKQALRTTIVNQPDEYSSEFDDIHPYDFLYLMYTKPDGEKLIKMKVQNKNVVLLVDFLTEVVTFFRRPFNGSDEQPYQMKPIFNNYPPMVIQVEVSNVWALILGSLGKPLGKKDEKSQDPSHSIGILLNVTYTQKWKGDSWFGPGKCTKSIEASLEKLLIYPTAIFDKNFRQYQRPIQFRSLIDPLKVSIKMSYLVDFWRDAKFEIDEVKKYYLDCPEPRKLQSRNSMKIRIHSKSQNNLSLSIKEIKSLTQIFQKVGSASAQKSDYTYFDKPIPKNPFEDDCVNQKFMQIQSLRTQILKNTDGIKVAQFLISDVILQDHSDNKQQKLAVVAQIQLDYFNKRKLDYEPAIEPWRFKITMIKREEVLAENNYIPRDVQRIKLSNRVDKDVKGKEVPFYLKDHVNSLNINITTALVEVTLEALKIFADKMADAEPYKIFNRSGYEIMLRDIKKDVIVTTIREFDSYQLQNQQQFKDSKRAKSEQQQMLLNLIVVKKQIDNNLLDDDQNSGSPIRGNTTIFSKTRSEETKQQKFKNFKYDLSNFKTIKYVNFDFVGKKFYPLERSHKSENQERAVSQKRTLDVLKSNFDKITDAILLTNSRKINEERNLQIQVSVNINPLNGSKEVQIQSTVKIFNYLDQPINIGFQVNGQQGEKLWIPLQSKDLFVVPIEYLENKTEIRFTPMKEDNQSDYQYYQLDQLLCDQCPISDFELDKDNQIIDILQNAQYYAEKPNGQQMIQQPVIKSEFKHMGQALSLKNDMVITSRQHKNGFKKQSCFHMIINCVKIKNQITDQKMAFLNQQGRQQIQKDDDQETCYETFLILNPIFRFTNAIVRPISLRCGTKQDSQINLQRREELLPGQSQEFDQLEYSEDIGLELKFPNHQQRQPSEINVKSDNSKEYTLPFKIFQRRLGFGADNTNKQQIQIKYPNSESYLHLYIVLSKRSQKSCEAVIYCPYLIQNETNLLLLYRENGLTKNYDSEDKAYYMTFFQGKGQDQHRFESHHLNSLHMFSTSFNIKKIQVAIGSFTEDEINKTVPVTDWSAPLGLQNTNVLEITGSSEIFRREESQNKYVVRKNFTKGKFETSMRIINAPGIYHRSKLIKITPRFIVHNETKLPIAMTQVECVINENDIIRVKPGDWKYFYWSNIKKPLLAMISFYQQQNSQIAGWSGYFKIQPQEIALMIPNPNKSLKDNLSLYILQKVNITLMDDFILLIRFTEEESVIPPYYIENLTRYEITFKQSSSHNYKAANDHQFIYSNEGNRGQKQVVQNIGQLLDNPDKTEQISFAAGGKETTSLQPGERLAFTWDNWIDDKEHVLEVEIEGQSESYQIDKIQNFRPLQLPGQNKKRFANKNYLYKQGNLIVKEISPTIQFYVTVGLVKQKLKIYSEDKKSHESYSLQGAKVEESKDKEFVLRINPEKMLSQTLSFEAESIDIANNWVDYLWRAILIDKPEMVELKIEPSNQTKVLTFFQNTSNEHLSQKRLIDDELTKFKPKLTQYKIAISNCIGISLIDEQPKEVIQTCIKNIQIEYNLVEEYTRDQGNKISMEEDELDRGITYQSMVQIDKAYVKQLKEYYSLKVDLMIINNQIINTQFPVLLAPNKKKISGEQQPFLMVSVFKKDSVAVNVKNLQNNSSQTAQKKSTISYIHTFSMFTDTLEIRLDHQILDHILQYTNQIKVLIADSNISEQTDEMLVQFDLKSLQSNLESHLKIIKQHSISKIYLKNLMLEPIDICFTLKSSPGHTMNNVSNNIIGDLGLTLASIDSAKIRLNSFKTQHIFGSSNDIIRRISKHYQGQFLTQIYKLLGSFELFGSPVSLISNLGTGVIDMFYEPFYAFVTGKSGYKVGEKFFTGAVTLIHTSITGVYKTVITILGTFMRILDQITLDKKYMSERSNRLNRTIRNFKEGIIIGVTNFGKILFATIIGVFEKPIRGLQEDGFIGFLLGIYQGIMGIIIKPTVGIYDLLITIIDGIKNTAVYEEHIMDTRYRPPRIFGENNLLIKFNFVEAIGTDIIRRFKLNVIDRETILFFDQLDITNKLRSKKKIEAQIVLTDLRIVYVLTHSSIHCDKIMLHKIKSLSYKQGKSSKSQPRLKFVFNTPIRKNWWKSNSTRYYLKYDNKQKADNLFKILVNLKETYNISEKNGHLVFQ